MKRGLRELVREEAEAWDVGRPTSSRWDELAERDLQRVARLGALDIDRTRDGVDLAEVERGNGRDGRIRPDLPAGRLSRWLLGASPA